MKRFLLGLAAFMFATTMLIGMAFGQTVYTKQLPAIAATGTVAFSTTNPVTAIDINTSAYRTTCYDIRLFDANASITSLDMTCAMVATTGSLVYTLPILVSTSAAGVTSSVPATWRQTATGGGAPGTSSWTWCVTNVPGPSLRCTFLANGVITADVDTLVVYARTITP